MRGKLRMTEQEESKGENNKVTERKKNLRENTS